MTSFSDLPRSTSLALNLDGVWLEWHTLLSLQRHGGIYWIVLLSEMTRPKYASLASASLVRVSRSLTNVDIPWLYRRIG
jgi:hypothetical protein